MSTFSCVLIADLMKTGEAELKTGPFGTQLKASEYVEHGTPVINVRNVGFGTIRSEKLEFVSPETRYRLRSHGLRAGDIVFGRKGAVERHAFIQPEHEGWLQGSDCLRLRFDTHRVVPRFASYYFLTSEHKQWITNQCSHGATMSSLNQGVIERIELPLPDPAIQKRLAATLSAYDELIENSERRIRLLEEMARAIYREWLVALRFPGHEDHQHVFSPAVGEIPEGWKVKKLADIAEVNRQQITARAAPERLLYIDISSVSPGRIDSVEEYAFDDAPGRARRVVRHGDVLFSCVRPNRRSHALVMHPEPDTIASTGFAVLTPRTAPASFLYRAVTTDDFVAYLTNNATGAAYPAVSGQTFKAADILVPPDDLLKKFDLAVAPLDEQIHTLHARIHALRATRDLLLPRLVSGQVELKVDGA